MQQELWLLMRRALWLDLSAYLISTFFLGVTVSFALGLILGTAVLFLTLLLLKASIERLESDAKRSGVTDSRRYQLFYAARLAVFAVAFGTAVVLRKWISPVAAALPMLYPRLIYTLSAVFFRSGSDSESRKQKR